MSEQRQVATNTAKIDSVLRLKIVAMAIGISRLIALQFAKFLAHKHLTNTFVFI